MIETLLLAGIILGICMILLCVKVIFIKGGRFPNTHVDGNRFLRKKGIHCAKSQDREAMKQKSLYDRLEQLNG